MSAEDAIDELSDPRYAVPERSVVAASPLKRRTLVAKFARDCSIPENRVNSAEVASIIQEAAEARNGWKVILARCAPVEQKE